MHVLSYHRFRGWQRALIVGLALPLWVILLVLPDGLPGAVLGALVVLLPFAIGGLPGIVVARRRHDQVTVGCLPFFWATFPLDRVVDVSVVDVRPWEDYRGWGIKGFAHGARGLLLSAGGHRALRLDLDDGRAYLVSVDGREEHVARALDSEMSLHHP